MNNSTLLTKKQYDWMSQMSKVYNVEPPLIQFSSFKLGIFTGLSGRIYVRIEKADHQMLLYSFEEDQIGDRRMPPIVKSCLNEYWTRWKFKLKLKQIL